MRDWLAALCLVVPIASGADVEGRAPRPVDIPRWFSESFLDIWGAREVTWLDGRVLPEKEFARLLDVQFTPTLLFFDERGVPRRTVVPALRPGARETPARAGRKSGPVAMTGNCPEGGNG